MIARAKAERKPDQPNFSQPIVSLAPYNANLEYRVGGLNAPASTHDKDAELFFVVEGSGTVVTGGTLQNERRTNPDNSSGTGIEGGVSRKICRRRLRPGSREDAALVHADRRCAGADVPASAPVKSPAFVPLSDSERTLVGLCCHCRWVRRVTSSRDRDFYLCSLSFADARFPKYPVLPVRTCPGFSPVDPADPHSTSH